MLLNFSRADGFDARVQLKGCADTAAQRVFTYTGDPRGFVERKPPPGAAYSLPPSSITVVELKFAGPPAAKAKE